MPLSCFLGIWLLLSWTINCSTFVKLSVFQLSMHRETELPNFYAKHFYTTFSWCWSLGTTGKQNQCIFPPNNVVFWLPLFFTVYTFKRQSIFISGDKTTKFILRLVNKGCKEHRWKLQKLKEILAEGLQRCMEKMPNKKFINPFSDFDTHLLSVHKTWKFNNCRYITCP